MAAIRNATATALSASWPIPSCPVLRDRQPAMSSRSRTRRLKNKLRLVGMAGFEPAASCSQSRRANQAAPHPVEPIRSLPSMGRDPRRRRASQEPPDAVTAEIRQRLPKLSSQGQWTSLPLCLGPPRSAATVRRRCPDPVRCPCSPVPRHSSHRACGRSSMAEPQPSKLVMRVRFPSPAPPSPAPTNNPRSAA
jgi:hypothetical protein